MGEIIEIEEDVLGIGRYRRVRVMLDVTKPLRRFRWIKDKHGRKIQIDFAYERLPFFCFACGIMGHSERDCLVVTEEDKQEGLGWSLGLKATPRKGRSKEIEEEKKFKVNKKLQFVAKESGEDASKVDVTTLVHEVSQVENKDDEVVLSSGVSEVGDKNFLCLGPHAHQENNANKDSSLALNESALIIHQPDVACIKQADPTPHNLLFSRLLNRQGIKRAAVKAVGGSGWLIQPWMRKVKLPRWKRIY